MPRATPSRPYAARDQRTPLHTTPSSPSAFPSAGAGATPASTPVAKLLPRMSRVLSVVTNEDTSANPVALAVGTLPALHEFSWMVFTAGPLFAPR